MAALEERLASLYASLASIGRAESSGGYRRYAWTTADLELRAWFRAQAESRGLEYSQDRNANQWAWWGRPGPGAVVTGSHLDSVPDGGAYDGPLGIVSAFLAVDELRERCLTPARPLAVMNLADEEGTRFGVACVGSRLLTGLLDPDAARELRDADGVSLAEAMQAAGSDPTSLGRDDEALDRIGVFVELHIEQGRGLVDLGAPVGVATAIWPHGRWRFNFAGEANHAGTTKLEDRRDPMLAFAKAILAARGVAAEAGALATFGKVRVRPNGTNAIASSVDAWLDARAPTDDTLRAVVADITAATAPGAAAHRVTLTVTSESRTPMVAFDAGLRDRLSGVLGGAPALPTGAGHDAGILAPHVPSGMLFVRNPTGISHSPAEHAEHADCVAGVHALAAVLADLCSHNLVFR